MGLARRNHPGRYTLLLFMILLLLLSEPLFVAHADLQMLATLMMIFLLFAALYTLNVGKAFFSSPSQSWRPPRSAGCSFSSSIAGSWK
ncbi:MAG: hypothetical protein ACLQAT_00165 [Candidatus Binataceae bacterium]